VTLWEEAVRGEAVSGVTVIPAGRSNVVLRIFGLYFIGKKGGVWFLH
jgi:hypothetical protein